MMAEFESHEQSASRDTSVIKSQTEENESVMVAESVKYEPNLATKCV